MQVGANVQHLFRQIDIDRAVHGERGRALFILAYAESIGRSDLARRCVASGLGIPEARAFMEAATREAAASATAVEVRPPNADGLQAVARAWNDAFRVRPLPVADGQLLSTNRGAKHGHRK